MRCLSKKKAQPKAPKVGELFFYVLFCFLFFPSTVSGVICWNTPLALEPADWNPGKTDRSQQRVRILTKVSSPSSLCVVPGEERKIKFHDVLSFPNSGRQVKNISKNSIFHLWFINLLSGTHWLSILSLLGIIIAFSLVSFCILKTWLGNHQVGNDKKKIWSDRNVGCRSKLYR